MKVIYDHQIFASQERGGISRYFTEIAARIGEMDGVSASVICPFHVNAFLSESSQLEVHGRRVGRISRSAVAMRALNAALSLAFFHKKQGANVFHETYYSRFDLAPKGAARIVTVHDMIHEKFPGSFSKFDRTAAAKLAALRRADHVICVSENTRTDLLELMPIAPEKVSVVHHASSLRPVSIRSGAIQPRFVYVGGRGGYKNFRGFLAAFRDSRLPRSGFRIACFGGGAFNTEERRAISDSGLSGLISQHHGDDADLARLLSTSSALVYPSLYEGFGIPPLEAMSVGCPVICSNTSSLPEVVGTAAITVDPNNHIAIRDAMEGLAASPEMASSLSRMGRARAKQFSWNASAQATMNAYLRAM